MAEATTQILNEHKTLIQTPLNMQIPLSLFLSLHSTTHNCLTKTFYKFLLLMIHSTSFSDSIKCFFHVKKIHTQLLIFFLIFLLHPPRDEHYIHCFFSRYKSKLHLFQNDQCLYLPFKHLFDNFYGILLQFYSSI